MSNRKEDEMLRISATTLESFRLLLQEGYVTEEELIAKVRQEPYERSWQARAGTAWHTCLERGQYALEHVWSDEIDDFSPLCEVDGFTFHEDAVQEGEDHVGPGRWELKSLNCINVDGAPLTVVSKIDHMHGLTIQDNKTKWSSVDLSAYDNSLQWRLYLLSTGGVMFRYNVFDFRPPKKSDSYCHLKAIRTVKYWPYPGMEQDCREWVKRFLDWARDRNLEKYLHREGTI